MDKSDLRKAEDLYNKLMSEGIRHEVIHPDTHLITVQYTISDKKMYNKQELLEREIKLLERLIGSHRIQSVHVDEWKDGQTS